MLSGAAQHLGAVRERGEQGLHFMVSFAAASEANKGNRIQYPDHKMSWRTLKVVKLH